MIKFIRTTIAIAALAGCLTASAGVDYNLHGTPVVIDTVFHAKVGPGTTQTQLRVTGGTKLDVFYVTIDRTTPGVSIKAACATDMVAGKETVADIARRKSKDGRLYFAGVNAGYFWTSDRQTPLNGSSTIGTPSNSNASDGELYRWTNRDINFAVDYDGMPYIGVMSSANGRATCGDKTTAFMCVNDWPMYNAVTLYTSKYYGDMAAPSEAGNCKEVTARLVEGDEFKCGGKYRLEVTSTPTSTGVCVIPENGFVIAARGNDNNGGNIGALDFVGGLKPGDIVEMDNKFVTAEGLPFVPSEIVTAHPHMLKGGVYNPEGEWEDLHPRTAIGFSEDRNKIIMLVVDGRSSRSDGVETSKLCDLMLYAGAHEAMNLDGGGSTTLYTSALGTRNVCSDGRERADGDAIYAVVDAEEDNNVAEVRFADWRRTVPSGGLYTPTVYAYNKAGVLIDTDFKDYTLSCDEGLGTVIADGKTLLASGTGAHALTVSYGDATPASIVVTVSDEKAVVKAKYDAVTIDNYRTWQYQALSVIGEEEILIPAETFTWTSADPEIATIDDKGFIKGLKDGKTTVTGTLGDYTISTEVNVEVPTVRRVDLFENEVKWRTPSGSNTTGRKISAIEGGGYRLEFKVSRRTSNVSVARQNPEPFWSLPDAFELEIKPEGNMEGTAINFEVKANNQASTRTFKVENLVSGQVNKITLDPSTNFDINDLGIYPLTFRQIKVIPENSVASGEYTIDFLKMVAVYNNAPVDGAEDITVAGSEAAALSVSVEGNTIVARGEYDSIAVYDLCGRLAAQAEGNTVEAPAAKGIYIVRPMHGNAAATAKIRL
ncbi:MAG: phosphodiester glycosidase family protein [Muribaculaceae bacterium]